MTPGLAESRDPSMGHWRLGAGRGGRCSGSALLGRGRQVPWPRAGAEQEDDGTEAVPKSVTRQSGAKENSAREEALEGVRAGSW